MILIHTARHAIVPCRKQLYDCDYEQHCARSPTKAGHVGADGRAEQTAESNELAYRELAQGTGSRAAANLFILFILFRSFGVLLIIIVIIVIVAA